MPMNRLIMSSSPQISYTMSFTMVLSSVFRRTGMKENAVIFYFRAGGDAFSQNIERRLSIFFIALSYMYTRVAAMCAALLTEFRTSANLRGFHVFALMHYSHSYIRYFLNFLSVIGRFTIEQLSFTACFGCLLSYTYAAAAICFLLNNFCTGLFTPC